MKRPERPLLERASDVCTDAYYQALGPMNRAERRTARGRIAVAEARAKALEAKLQFLENQIKHNGGAA